MERSATSSERLCIRRTYMCLRLGLGISYHSRVSRCVEVDQDRIGELRGAVLEPLEL